ncbi:hypothetical protein G3T36_17765 [Diaminobutyricibacter tongyongensis]|uniref:DUF4386 family protein n=1 Tax=Leifsonia tongyongensis TaxID=1268043 RepID=A0A6L9Y2B7_9MICO|nr:hypothetical protein [Diaminobutyricibacter tongyongensis]NEN07706.1 hypothetical protein [Diaminobutyricibacter tongyongensis]
MAALEGLAAALLMTASIYLIERQPGVGTARPDLSWYGDPRNRALVEIGLDFGVVGMIGFLWFMAVIRRRLAEREDQFYATVFLGSGIMFAILATTAAVCAAAPTLVVHFGGEESLSDSTIALAHGLWFGLWGIGASRFAGFFMSATSTLGLRFGALPTWLGRIGYVLGLLLVITGAFAGPLDFLFPAWLALVSITLLFSSRDRSAHPHS